MVKTTHVRAALHQVLAVLDSTVGDEEVRRSEMTLAPRVITVRAETVTLPPEVPGQALRMIVAERALLSLVVPL